MIELLFLEKATILDLTKFRVQRKKKKFPIIVYSKNRDISNIGGHS